MASAHTGIPDNIPGSPVSETDTISIEDRPLTASEHHHHSEENSTKQENEAATSDENQSELTISPQDSTPPDLLADSFSTDQQLVSAATSSSINVRESTGEKDTCITEKKDTEDKIVKSPTVRFSSASKGSNSEEVEVIEFTHTEIMDFETSGNRNCCGPFKGPHIVLFTILCFPAALFISLFGAFYYGALTWYNLLTYFSEEKKIWHKIFICPVIILSFPITVGLTALIISVVSAFIQISWSFTRWREVILDVDKGFYGWLCEKLSVPMCSPYDSFIIHEDSELEPMRT